MDVGCNKHVSKLLFLLEWNCLGSLPTSLSSSTSFRPSEHFTPLISRVHAMVTIQQYTRNLAVINLCNLNIYNSPQFAFMNNIYNQKPRIKNPQYNLWRQSICYQFLLMVTLIVQHFKV